MIGYLLLFYKNICCEGEIDGLSIITSGLKFVISVPNGVNKNLDFLDNCFELFEEKVEIILAVDADPKTGIPGHCKGIFWIS